MAHKMKILEEYLKFIEEQQFGVPPQKPVQNPQPGRAITPAMTKQKSVAPKTPISPQQQKLKSVPNQTRDQQKNNKKTYFNYMVWTSKILKQGEIFRKNCYTSNCDQYEIGTGDRRICKDRCDIETCKRVIKLLRASASKCSSSENPDLCRVRYAQLIPLYQAKLNKISLNYVKATKVQKKQNFKVG